MTKRIPIPAAVRNQVWNTFIGVKKGTAKCFCCNTEYISRATFECGHITSVKEKGQTNVQNLRPICGPCNKSMGTINMVDFMEKYGFPKRNDFDKRPAGCVIQ